MSGGKKYSTMTNMPFRPSFGDFRKFFKILAEFPSLEFLVLLFQDKRTENQPFLLKNQKSKKNCNILKHNASLIQKQEFKNVEHLENNKAD